MFGQLEQVRDAEKVYRRVPDREEYFAESERSRISPFAFRPDPKRDADGLSLIRDGFGMSLEQIADRGPGKSTILATLRAGEVRRIGLQVMPDPTPESPGHCILPGLNARMPKHAAKELQLRLVDIVLELLGPFRSPAE